jgi:hypothetical protein
LRRKQQEAIPRDRLLTRVLEMLAGPPAEPP